MRELLSFRMLAALVGLLVAFWLVSAITGDDSADGGVDGTGETMTDGIVERHIDLVARVTAVEPVDAVAGFDVESETGAAGVAVGSADLLLEGDRRMRVVSGTFGVDDCSTAEKRVGRCAVFADLLGEAVVWFQLSPIDDGHVELPAVVGFDDDLARLANGFLLPHAEVFTRRCATEYASFTEFRRDLGEDFVTLWSLEEGQLTDVICRR